MALIIKKPETDAAARTLVSLTGETLTQAVDVAVRERLARIQRRQDVAARRMRIEKALALVEANRSSPILSDDALYDETGAPR